MFDPGKFQKILLDLTKQDLLLCRICTIKSVDKDAFTCVVSPIDNSELEFNDIKLSVNDSSTNCIFPSVNSTVIVSFLDANSGYVSLFSEIDQYYQATSVESISAIIIDFITAIKNIQLTHPYGPTTPNGVINITDFEDIENRIKKFYLK